MIRAWQTTGLTTNKFISSVENNPVLEGWGSKIVSISPGK